VKIEQVDYAVIGESLAGVAAATTIARSGGRVVLLNYDRDTDTIADIPLIRTTSLGTGKSGLAFEQDVMKVFRDAGGEQCRTCHLTAVRHDDRVVIESNNGWWSCLGVVFAPNGTEPGLDGSTALHGFGVSYSASSDAPFFRGRRVAVYGDSPRVYEHAAVAARYAAEVVVLVKDTAVESDAGISSGLNRRPSVKFEEGAVVRSLHAEDHSLKSIVIDSRNGPRTIDVDALFVAQHLVVDKSILPAVAPSGNLVFAGLAAGIEYWKHAELMDDGGRAARTMLSSVEQ